jgi:hypothetical protein
LPALRSVVPADGRCGCFHPSGPTCRFACPLRPFSSKDWPTNFPTHFRRQPITGHRFGFWGEPIGSPCVLTQHADPALSFASLRSSETDRPT